MSANIRLDFSDKRALVIGSEKGIGAAVKHQLLNAGCDVVGTSRTTTDDPSVLPLDLSNAESVDAFIQCIEQDFTFDYLIHNAGIILPEPADMLSADAIKTVCDVNLISPLKILSAVAGQMKSRKHGKIVGIASIASVVSKPNSVVYSSSKSGFVGALRSLAVELAEYGILVNSISPGPTNTEMIERWVSDEKQKEIARTIPLKRLACVDDIANVVLFLCSDLNTYITAQNIIVDGGFTST